MAEWVERVEAAVKAFVAELKGRVGDEVHSDIDNLAHTLKSQLKDVVSTVEADAKADASTAAGDVSQVASDAQNAPQGSSTLPNPGQPA